MFEHVLMAYATRRPYRATPALPDGARYDPVKGYWIKNDTPLVTAQEFLEGGPVTKKCDQETGEDQKGE
ncbi:MAG: hypothetical protein WCF16_03365 [Alphaproteobacteria bacterium]